MKNDISERFMDRNRESLQSAKNYYKWNFSLFPFEKGKRILDIGCGPCIYYEQIVALEPQTYLATDFSPYFLGLAAELFAGHQQYRACQLDLLDESLPSDLITQHFDYVLCFDVLEHIEDDEKALRNIHRIMLTTRSKNFFVRVPALQGIYGENDRAIGHFRRYSMKSFSSLLSKCGFRVNMIRYQNFLGIFPWYFVGKVLRRSQAVSNNSLANEGKLINAVSPLLRKLEQAITPPIGLSLYSVCEIEK